MAHDRIGALGLACNIHAVRQRSTVMKDRRTLALSLAVIALAACDDSESTVVLPTITVTGSGVLAEELRDIASFTTVSHASEGTLTIDTAAMALGVSQRITSVTGHDGSLVLLVHEKLPVKIPAGRLLVRAEDNLIQHLVTEVSGRQLEIRTEPGFDLEPTLPIEFFATVTSLDSASLAGVGGITIEDLSVSSFSVDGAGVGLVDLSNLQATTLDIDAGGFVEVRASGSVEEQTVRLSGFGSYQADMLQSAFADVLTAGIGSATVRVSDTLIATVTSSGSIFYIGDPTVDATITGTGTVEQIGE